MYEPEIAATVCARIAAGQSLRTIEQDPAMPSMTTVCRWLQDDPEFREQYARAREALLEGWSSEIIELADKPLIGEKTEKKEVGRECSECGKPVRWLRGAWRHSDDGASLCDGASAQKVVEERVTTGDNTERTKIQIDARKWLLGKLKPKVYGHHQPEPAAPATGPQITVVVMQAGQQVPEARPLELPSGSVSRETDGHVDL